MPALMNDSEKIIWKEKVTSRIRAIQMDNVRSLLDIRKIYKVLNACIRELCGVMKGLLKMLSGGSVMWKEWRMTQLLRKCM